MKLCVTSTLIPNEFIMTSVITMSTNELTMTRCLKKRFEKKRHKYCDIVFRLFFVLQQFCAYPPKS